MLGIFPPILDRHFLKNLRFVTFLFTSVSELITTVRNHCTVQVAGLICYPKHTEIVSESRLNSVESQLFLVIWLDHTVIGQWFHNSLSL
jgi:hypothetical protein